MIFTTDCEVDCKCKFCMRLLMPHEITKEQKDIIKNAPKTKFKPFHMKENNDKVELEEVKK